MNSLPLAFLLGLFGSLHCAVMCGPLMLSLPIAKKGHLHNAFQLLSYQLGRTMVYTCMGMLMGLIGSSITIITGQSTFSIIIGALMVFFAIMHFSGNYFKSSNPLQLRMVAVVSKLMGMIYGKPMSAFLAGALNGLIPCGMVYLALATAVNSSSVLEAGQFMFLFGLGTTPLMLLISLGGLYLKKYISFRPNKLIPWFMLILGSLFILRSAELGIPFISPGHHLGPKGYVSECR